MACHLRGAEPLRTELEHRLQSTSEKDISCLGQCDGAPAISINDRIYRNVDPVQAEAFALAALGGGRFRR
jgi:NADH:ubiquinone oxidoreductase subunit E